MKVAVVKYNAGNIFSVLNSLRRLGVEPTLTDDVRTLQEADRIIFPGQGEASGAMAYLRVQHMDEVITRLTQPFLGICIGQQLMCRHSEEGNVDCLGLFPLDVKRFCPLEQREKVPHMGWNQLYDLKTPLMKGLSELDFAYFVHSFYVPVSEFTIATTDYIYPFSAALHRDNFYATQFHPEKSGDVGERIIRNFLEL